MAQRRQILAQRVAAGRVVPVKITGIPAPYYAMADDVDTRLHLRSSGWRRPIRFLPPLDNLLWDRDRLVDLFDFYYRWEVYVPPAKRDFGVYAMPILAGDRLAGRIDPEFRRDTGTLVVHNLRWEPWATAHPTLIAALEGALVKYAGRLGAAAVNLVGPNRN